jgi:Uncharacterized protein conserved in bacteria
LGKVKTRLAATVGDEMALAVYLALAAHTREVANQFDGDKVLYYSDALDTEDQWKSFDKAVQRGNDLGERMENAFRESFALGYQAVCIIGTDCLELNTAHISMAFERLKTNEAVIGPAVDGGYYLLGMKKLVPALFQHKNWSTNSVLEDTLNDFKKLNLSFAQLEVLNDVDEEKDLPSEWKKGLRK